VTPENGPPGFDGKKIDGMIYEAQYQKEKSRILEKKTQTKGAIAQDGLDS